MERHLAAILSADVVGYSRLMELDESGTLARLMAHRNEFIDPTIAAHRGRIVKLMGDGALVEFASVVDALAFVSNYSGELEVGLEAIEEAKRLNPRYSYIYLAVEGHLNFLKGEYENALALYEQALQRNPAFDRGILLYAAVLAHMGNIDDAAWAIAEALSVRPDLTLHDERRDANYKRPEDLERYIEGLRKAGLPE